VVIESWSKKAIPVASTSEQAEYLNTLNDPTADSKVVLTEKEILQIADSTGMQTSEVKVAINDMMDKFKIPYGMIRKLLELKEFKLLDFIIDDSYSMTWDSDVKDSGRIMSRWEEVHSFFFKHHRLYLG
jgi:hypothetical protein